MVIKERTSMTRVSLTLDPIDVDLLDRLGKLDGSNRSAMVRDILQQFRPMLTATVEAFEAAQDKRLELDKAMAQAAVEQLEAVMPEVEQIQKAYLGALARIEGAATAKAAENAPASNTGATHP